MKTIRISKNGADRNNYDGENRDVVNDKDDDDDDDYDCDGDDGGTDHDHDEVDDAEGDRPNNHTANLTLGTLEVGATHTLPIETRPLTVSLVAIHRLARVYGTES